MSRTRIQWRMALIGATGVAVLVVVWVSLPGGAPDTDEAADRVIGQVYGAIEGDDAQGLRRAREQLRRHVHRDLLGRRLPGLLRVVIGLEAIDRQCNPQRGSRVEQGICWLRRGVYGRAVLAFAEVEDGRGGAAYREVAARLLRLHQRAGDRAEVTRRKVP